MSKVKFRAGTTSFNLFRNNLLGRYDLRDGIRQERPAPPGREILVPEVPVEEAVIGFGLEQVGDEVPERLRGSNDKRAGGDFLLFVDVLDLDRIGVMALVQPRGRLQLDRLDRLDVAAYSFLNAPDPYSVPVQ